ncbi:AI-2E family transporter [Tunicatimonas pelagia]|uniref:AI-2E family transporter n=1 Tax=Tunicatimonas pelagia TaxID=931531 RepID=UPI0026656F1D|nr:AI-2E family transporter [Tunicatimonas pelagia]WKN43427.1 AI-2E family transporter [Tunicatimonas pelagia]
MTTITQQLSVVKRANPFLLFLLLFFGALYLGSSFLIPLAIAVLISLALVSVSQWLEQNGLNRGLSSFLAVLLVFLFFVGVFSLVTYQISSLADNWEQTKQQVTKTLENIKSYLDQSGISTQWMSERLDKISESSSADVKNMVSATFTTLGKFFLILIYTYLLLYYRDKFKRFIQKLTPKNATRETNEVITQVSKIARAYISGKFLLIIILAVLYGVGFIVIGIKYALVIAVIAGVLSIIPYFGNIIGGGLALLFALITSSSLNSVIGVAIVMTIAQLLENYVLTPLIVGKKVDLNPFFTIIVVVLGGAVWGIPGTVVAVPYLGILRILFDHTNSLKPYAYLMGDNSDDDSSSIESAKEWIEEKVS